jgi:ferredoxin
VILYDHNARRNAAVESQNQSTMKINPDKCVACGNCTYVCPVGAIYVDPVINRATVNRDECVECYACYYGLSTERMNPVLVRTIRKLFQMARLRFDPEPDICPTSAFEPEDLQWPRVVRRAFSDPRATHESTGVQGRGTEEVKTNDVTQRVKQGEVGFTIEFGRPGVGVWFRDIQKMTQALARANVPFEKKNPLTLLMSDVSTGTLKQDILGEKVLSAIVEIRVAVDRTEEIIHLVHEVEKNIDSVVALGVGTRCDENGEEHVVAPILERLGYRLQRAKTNTGLGRITNHVKHLVEIGAVVPGD